MSKHAGQPITRAVLLMLAVATFLSAAGPGSRAQEGSGPPPERGQQTTTTSPEATLENTIDAEESSEPPERQLVTWNEYHGPDFTLRFGLCLLLHLAGFSLDGTCRQLLQMPPSYPHLA